MKRNNAFKWSTAAILIVVAAIVFVIYRNLDAGTDRTKRSKPVASVKVRRVASANRIKTNKDGDVMLAGIRAQHLHEPHGPEAVKLVRSLIEGRRVRIRFDEKLTDRKDRFVGYVFIGETMVNERLVHDGLAYVRLREGQVRYRDELLAAQRDAMATRRGLWKSRGRDIKGDYIGDRKHGTFHSPSCPDVANIKPEDKVNFAGTGAAFEEGFAPCGHCRR